MRKLNSLLAIFFILSSFAYADVATKNVVIKETDGSPSGVLRELTVTNATLTNNGGGKFAVTTGGGESTTVSDTTTINLTLTGSDITADGLYTAGDALTLTGANIDFDGGTAPGGELGGTWDSFTIDDSLAVTSWNLTTPTITTSLTTDGKTISEAEIGRLDGLTSAIIDDDKIDTYSELNTIVADATLTHNGLIDTYSELNTIVADVTLTHNGLIDTFAELDAIVADASLEKVVTAGRSLTKTVQDILADAELYTDTKTLYIEDPVAADDLQTIWVAPLACTITKIHYESDQTVVFDLQIDDGTPTGVNGSDITCTTFATDSSLAGDTTMAAGDRLDLAITSVSGTPTWFSVTFEFTFDD